MRSWLAPWGIASLSPSQLVQVRVSNYLFQATVELLAVAACCNAGGWLEHPAPSNWEPRSVPSWHFRPVRALAASPVAALTDFDQCEFGQSGKAPTQILSIRLDDLPQRLRDTPGRGRCSHPRGFHGPMLGWDPVLSRWRNAPRNLYPPQLCRQIAMSMLTHIRTSIAVDARDDLLDPEAVALLAFCVPASLIPAEAQEIAPDFARRAPRGQGSSISRIRRLLDPAPAAAAAAASLGDQAPLHPTEEQELQGTHSVAVELSQAASLYHHSI